MMHFKEVFARALGRKGPAAAAAASTKPKLPAARLVSLKHPDGSTSEIEMRPGDTIHVFRDERRWRVAKIERKA